jgi:hypothetical protein
MTWYHHSPRRHLVWLAQVAKPHNELAAIRKWLTVNKPFFDLAAESRENQRKAQLRTRVYMSKIPSRPEGQLEQS